ncbi:FAD-binding oxidoreductase [Lentzea sp. NPDC058450]|uniref:FAD-binding oxidoreductase n=1 Tax=Lentzea sp. NPDC058450 TaxID=3346505 RepID=UPI00365FF305
MGFLDELTASVTGVSTAPDDLAAAATDRSGTTPDGLPAAVVRASTVDEVRRTLRLAHDHGVPVVPRGAGTGLAGGAVAGTGSVVLDVSGLDRILSMDPVDEIAVVEPGVITAELDRAAGEFGLRYAPDPASAAISTIGGNIATNAGGMRCVKYGVTREAVLGLDVVLADGRLISTGRRTVKGVAGLDLTALFVGSEGTLGVVVGATLRLRALPAQTFTAVAAYDSVAAAATACSELARARREPSLLELLDGATLDVVDRAQGTDYSARGTALVIAQADGAAADSEIAAIAEVLGKEATWLSAEGDPDRLLFARRMALPSIERFGRALIEDICVPRSRLADAFEGVGRIARERGVEIYSFAHAGDGNLHPIIGYDKAADRLPDAVREAGDDIFALALELGGTVTGEHGVGLLKRDWLAREAGADVLDVHATLKSALDPRGILNPGKGF